MLSGKVARILCAGWLVVTGMCGAAWAGETNVYLKSGYFTWKETINGADFVKENGMMNAVGVCRSDTVSGNVTLEELVEVWGGSLDYDGHDVTNTTTLKSDTIYLGTREEFTAGMKFPVAETFSVGPLAGFGHKFWIRTRSNEDWNTIYAKAGAAAEYSPGAYRFFLKSGVSMPFFTRSHVNLNAAGYEDVTTEPEGKPSLFVEGGVRRASWSVSISYEEMNFGQSDKVATKSTAARQNGVAIINSEAFQPKSSSSFISLNVAYHF